MNENFSLNLLGVILIYIVLCALFAMTKLDIKVLYPLDKKSSSFSSLIFYTVNASRVTPALCYNFI